MVRCFDLFVNAVCPQSLNVMLLSSKEHAVDDVDLMTMLKDMACNGHRLGQEVPKSVLVEPGSILSTTADMQTIVLTRFPGMHVDLVRVAVACLMMHNAISTDLGFHEHIQMLHILCVDSLSDLMDVSLLFFLLLAHRLV
jgi:hypothetical protein